MQRYRIVTFNIAHGRGLSPFQGLHGRRRFQRNLQKIAKMLGELEPDIVALQEIDENSRWSGSFDHLEYLNSLLDFPHAVFGVNNRRVGESLRIIAQNNAPATRRARRLRGWSSSFFASSRE